ncbi:M23 family metallopeptidase [Polycladomyces subterraneus]|uniref:Peptidoglycan DD-metalloendopeptidase family protein n=1 Tax=Polycladomyces subterraneus TaxID=1016997 RepID=A0ABT8INN1_9BACL|nr:M23 family metallopeptidase [Polycladomyces subterraneus]MDN4594386.1 peptidoglycan DD-metalloendopeptidase family protein [Polycladomyces subterraneus]
MERRGWIGVMVVSLALAGWPADGVVHGEAKADQKKKELEQIQRQKNETQIDIQNLKPRLAAHKQKLTELDKQMYELGLQEKQAKAEWSRAEKEWQTRSAIFKQRVRMIYQSGNMGYMSALLQADSVEEFLVRFETLRLIVKQDRDILNRYFAAKARKEQVHQKLIAVQQQLTKTRVEAKTVYDRLAEQVNKNQTKLAHLEDEEEIKKEELQQIEKWAYSDGDWQGGLLMRPVNGLITSPYGWRVHPVTGRKRFHAGIDFGGPIGTPIHAAADGVVKESRPASGYGWIIILDHGGLTTLYGHMYGSTVRVSVGERIRRGQVIAEIGNAGTSTGPHLHFEVSKNGILQNPIQYLR